MWCPTFGPKINPSHGPISKLNYLPHPWTHPTYHPKRHPYLISQPFCHNAPTDIQTDTQTNRWLEGKSDDYEPLLLYRERRGLIITTLQPQSSFFPHLLLVGPYPECRNTAVSTHIVHLAARSKVTDHAGRYHGYLCNVHSAYWFFTSECQCCNNVTASKATESINTK